MQRLLIVLLTLTLVSACHQIVSPYEKDRERVKELIDTLIAANNRSDLSTVTGLYEQNAELLPPGKPVISGKSAIEGNYRQLFSGQLLHLSTSITEIKVGDIWAVAVGNNRGTITRKSDSVSVISNIDEKYMMLLEKQESGWKIRRLIWNSSRN